MTTPKSVKPPIEFIVVMEERANAALIYTIYTTDSVIPEHFKLSSWTHIHHMIEHSAYLDLTAKLERATKYLEQAIEHTKLCGAECEWAYDEKFTHKDWRDEVSSFIAEIDQEVKE